jgi:hypothetical protein
LKSYQENNYSFYFGSFLKINFVFQDDRENEPRFVMNLYFVSLLKSDFPRKKNVANLYPSVNSGYCYQRFPFLEFGDIVNPLNPIVIENTSNQEQTLHPFFCRYVSSSHSTSLSQRDIDRLKKAKLIKDVIRFSFEDEVCFFVRGFRICKMKFDLYLFSSSDDELVIHKIYEEIKVELENANRCAVNMLSPDSRILYVNFY